jgi:segregation and condensation protein B
MDDYTTTGDHRQSSTAELEPVSESEHGQPLPLKALIESLLFVATEPVRIDRMASVLGVTQPDAEHALQELAQEYAQQRGIRLQFKDQRVQMVTAPEATEAVRQFLGLDLSSRLSPAALETLAIVAYRQPVTRPQIEKVRGVNSDGVLRTLLSRGLIEEAGRLEQAGRPILYTTSFAFLQQFGLSSLDQLPSLDPEVAP